MKKAHLCFLVCCLPFFARSANGSPAGLFNKPSGNSATSQLCKSLSDPEIARPFKSEAEALAALKAAIEKRVESNPKIEYGATIVKCGGEFWVETIASGTEDHLSDRAASTSGKQYKIVEGTPQWVPVNIDGAEIVCGMHYHPKGSLTASIGDFISSNSSGYPEYIVVRDEGGKGLSPDIGKLSPEGFTTIVRLAGDKIVESPEKARIMEELAQACKGVNIKEKIESNVSNGSLNGNIVHDDACPPEKGIPRGTFSHIDTNGTVSDRTGPSQQTTKVPANQTQTIDNTAIKQWASQQLEDAYRCASGLAAEAGVGAEYQSAVAPVMSQGRAAINAIPDQQTITVPAQ